MAYFLRLFILSGTSGMAVIFLLLKPFWGSFLALGLMVSPFSYDVLSSRFLHRVVG